MREIFADKDTVGFLSLSLSLYLWFWGGRRNGSWVSGLVFRDCGADGGSDHDCGVVRLVG